MASPSMTFGSAGNVRSSASLAAAASASHTTGLDFSAKIEGQVTVIVTPGASVSSVRGVRVEFFPRYGTTPTDSTIPTYAYDMPSQTASTAESRTFYLGTGKWKVSLRNLDASHAVTVEITADTVDGIG